MNCVASPAPRRNVFIGRVLTECDDNTIYRYSDDYAMDRLQYPKMLVDDSESNFHRNVSSEKKLTLMIFSMT